MCDVGLFFLYWIFYRRYIIYFILTYTRENGKVDRNNQGIQKARLSTKGDDEGKWTCTGMMGQRPAVMSLDCPVISVAINTMLVPK